MGIELAAAFMTVYIELHVKWLREPAPAMDLTLSRHLHSPLRLTVVKWVNKAWYRISTDVIVRSFEAFGITSDDPHHMHCTKHEGKWHCQGFVKNPSKTWTRVCSI